jgi:PAS domain-containing protein
MADAVERTERELSAARARLDAVLHALPMGVGVLSREHPRLLYVNPRLHELTGAEAGNAADLQALLRRLRIRRPDGTPIPPEELPTARTLATGEPAFSDAALITRPDGVEVPFVAHARPVSLLGGEEFDAIVLVVLPVPERREGPRPPGEPVPGAGAPAAPSRAPARRPSAALSGRAKPPA